MPIPSVRRPPEIVTLAKADRSGFWVLAIPSGVFVVLWYPRSTAYTLPFVPPEITPPFTLSVPPSMPMPLSLLLPEILLSPFIVRFTAADLYLPGLPTVPLNQIA